MIDETVYTVYSSGREMLRQFMQNLSQEEQANAFLERVACEKPVKYRADVYLEKGCRAFCLS